MKIVNARSYLSCWYG